MPDPRRDRLAVLQNAFVRLLFCDETFELYRSDRSALGARFGLDAAAVATLPDPESDQLGAERHGRKMGVLAEIRRNFPNAFPALEQRPGFGFAQFLSSETFFDPAAALPHPFGVGAGYENTSKFYFWLRDAIGLSAPAMDARLRMLVNGDFAAYLIGQFRRGGPPYYDRFRKGVFWDEVAGTPLPLIYMTEDLHVFRHANAAERAAVTAAGAADIDAVAPEPAVRRENIR